MKSFRFKKLFDNDGRESSLTQHDLKKYARLAVIEDVDPERGLCNIRWLDRPGMRKDVIITQNSPTNYSFPQKGSIVVCVFDRYDRAFIASYIPLGQITKVQNLKTLPKFKEGETFFEAGGSYIHIRKNGNIILSTSQGYMLLDNNTDTFNQEFANWRVIAEGVKQSSGLVKRYVTNSGNRNIEVIEKSNGDVFIEHKLKVYETNAKDSNLLYDLTIGTIIDSEGSILNRVGDSINSLSSKQLCFDLKLNNGIRITIDKEGFVQIDNTKLFLNNPSVDEKNIDSEKGLINNSNLGTKGQHVAREHDKVTIPFGNSYQDNEHLGLEEKASLNLSQLVDLLKSIFSSVTYTPGLTPFPVDLFDVGAATVTSKELNGEITEGAENIQFGDN